MDGKKEKLILKVSIITATYNSAESIELCLESIRSQTYSNIEHIIIDGNSNDNTLEKIKNFPYKPYKIICEKDNGIYEALNKGIKYANGDIIGFLHSDDFFANNEVLEDVAETFKNNNIDAVYGDLEYVSQKSVIKTIRKWKSSPFKFKYLNNGWMPPHPSLYVKKDIINSLGGFDTSFKISGDYMFILKAFKMPNFNSKYIPKVFIKMRIGGVSNKSLSKILLKSKEDWIALRKNHFGFFSSIKVLMFKNISKLIQFF